MNHLLIANLDNKDLIAHIIAKAIEEPSGKYHEFQDVSFHNDFNKAKNSLWVKAFRENLGFDEKTVLASKDQSANKEAMWAGYNVINVHEAIAKTLRAAGIPDSIDILKSKCPSIAEESLTEKEREVLNLARWLDRNEIIFPKSDVETDYRVFETAICLYDGKPREGVLGYCNIGNRREIGFKRSVLNDPIQFMETYLEEKAHQLSGAADGDRLHFNKALHSTMWTIFLNSGEKIIAKFKEVFKGFDIKNIVVEDFPGDNTRQRLVYKRL